MVRKRKSSPESGKPVRVGETHVGKGVFAARPIRRNETIGEIRGLFIRDPGYTSEYCLDIGGGFALEPDPPYRFLNHCCRPNCDVHYVDDPDEECERVWLYAQVDILSGVELTIDYSWPVEGAIPCRCGSPQCRGWIVAEEDLPLLLAKLANERLPPAETM